MISLLPMIRHSKFPVVERGPLAVKFVIDMARSEGRLGFDCEYSPISGPTIIGVASKTRAAACFWSREMGLAIAHCGVPISAYAGIGADKPVLEKALGVTTPLSSWEDPMLKHWIVHPDLASVPKASYGEDRDDGHVMGMMNLWIATSLLHDVGRWKGCLAEIDSSGNARQAALAEICVARKRICPIHNELAYCSIDAWAGLVDDYSLDEQMAALHIPRSWYEFRRAVAEYCWQMQYAEASGLDIDIEAATALDLAIKSKKAALFPARLDYTGKTREKKVIWWQASYEVDNTGIATVNTVKKKSQAPKIHPEYGTKRIALEKLERREIVESKKLAKPRVIWEGPFNPNSPQAVLQWFSDQGIHLRDRVGKPTMGKQVLLAETARRLRPHGLALDPETGVLSSTVGDDSELPELPEALDLLVRLAQKTLLGKGLASWLDLKYLTNGRVRSRFNAVGTSTSRLSSSKPNATNYPARGFGIEVRKLIIARPGYCLVKADASQLELRACLWSAGLKHDFQNDIFQELADASAGKFDSAAARNNMTARDIAKSVSHASNYFEGLKLLTEVELSSSRNLADRGAGALLVYDGRDLPLWKFRGRVVCSTCSNLAERLFGSRTRENRAKAHEIQNVYLSKFAIREWQMKVAREIEETREVRLVAGHRVSLYGREPEDDLKFALAVHGQGTGAVYIQEGMLCFGAMGRIAPLQVHDELVFTAHVQPEASDEEVLEFMRPLVQRSKLLPGFACPAKVARSLPPGTGYKDKKGVEHLVRTHNWKETRELGTIRV